MLTIARIIIAKLSTFWYKLYNVIYFLVCTEVINEMIILAIIKKLSLEYFKHIDGILECLG